MTQEDRELLIKDLSARLPYGVKAEYKNEIFGIEYVSPMYEEVKLDTHETWTVDVSEVKPYLFPLSSMTEEQKQEYTYIMNYISPDDTDNWKEGEFIYVEQFTQLMHFYHKNHLDYRGLITMGLATDATGLNIY